MQTLPACRVYTLQVDERCTAALALIEAMLNQTARCSVTNGQEIEILSPRWDTHLEIHLFLISLSGIGKKEMKQPVSHNTLHR